MDLLLGTNQAADYLGVSRNTIRRWHKQGKIKGIKTFGGHRRFYKSELDRVLKENSDKEQYD